MRTSSSETSLLLPTTDAMYNGLPTVVPHVVQAPAKHWSGAPIALSRGAYGDAHHVPCDDTGLSHRVGVGSTRTTPNAVSSPLNPIDPTSLECRGAFEREADDGRGHRLPLVHPPRVGPCASSVKSLGVGSTTTSADGRPIHPSLVQIFDTSLEYDPLEPPNSSGSCGSGAFVFASGAAGSSGSLEGVERRHAARPTVTSLTSSQAPDPTLDPGSSWTSLAASITSPTRIAQLFQAVVEAWESEDGSVTPNVQPSQLDFNK